MADDFRLRKFFTTGQLAKICGAAPRTISKWIDSGALKGYRIPGCQDRRVPRQDLIRFLKENGMPLGDLEDGELYRVLLAGCAAALAEQLLGLLPAGEYRVSAAATGFEAALWMKESPPDCAVIDLAGDRAGRLELARAMRRNDGGLAIILLAGEDEADLPGLRGECREVLGQPFGPEALAGVLARLAEEARGEGPSQARESTRGAALRGRKAPPPGAAGLKVVAS